MCIIILKLIVNFLVQICSAFQYDENHLPCISSPDDLNAPLSRLSISGLNHFELEDMFEEGVKCKDITASRSEDILAKIDRPDDDPLPDTGISLISLLAGSETFQKRLLKIKTDNIYCALQKSILATIVSPSKIRALALGGKEVEITRIGSEVYSSRKSESCTWYTLISGKLKVSMDDTSKSNCNESSAPYFELHPGEVFCAYGIHPNAPDTVHVVFETMQPSKYIELSDVHLRHFVEHDPESAAPLLSMVAGA